MYRNYLVFFFSSRRRHTRWPRDWSSDVCSSDLAVSSQSVESVQTRQKLGVERRLAHQRLARQTTTMSVARLVPNRFVRRRRRSPLWAVRCRKTADWRHQRLDAGGSNRPIRDTRWGAAKSDPKAAGGFVPTPGGGAAQSRDRKDLPVRKKTSSSYAVSFKVLKPCVQFLVSQRPHQKSN